MKNKYLLPFALSSVVSALSGCGGESANIIPEVNDSSTKNGACSVGTEGCVEFALDYPLDGLNFSCSSDTANSFISILDLNEGAATGSCRAGDKVTFFIKSEKDKKIDLGTLELNSIARVSTLQVPRLTILDIATGMTKQPASALSPTDNTVKVAMQLAKILQALALQENKIAEPTDIQALYITDPIRKKLDLILSSVSAQQMMSGEYVAIIRPWLDVSVISDEQAFKVVSQLLTIANAAVYQPEFSLFSTSGALGNLLSGSDGLVGCNKQECNPTDSSTKHLFGHFMLITDRQGYTFGSGLQWKGAIKTSLSTISGVNAELIRQVKPVRMTAPAQSHWINPINKRIDQDYQMQVADEGSAPLIIYQGRLYHDYMIAGKESFYKLLTNKTTINSEDLKDLGQWRQNLASGEVYKGSLDLYKTFPITYLDKKVFQSIANVQVGQKYLFPLYADLTFKFTDSSVAEVKLGIVIDRHGDIRSNIKADATENDLSTAAQGCSTADMLDPSTFKDASGVQQYRLGTVARAFTAKQSISLRMILANNALGKINGGLVGMNSTIKTSANSASNNVVVGGALLNLANLLDPALNSSKATTKFTDSNGESVKWGNSLASFQTVYNNSNPTGLSSEDIALAKLSGGTVDFALADCYNIAIKNNL